jgi:putative oxidoreductase
VDPKSIFLAGWGLLLLRVTIGAVFLAHGVQKVLPIWGSSPPAVAAFFDSLGLSPGLPIAMGVGVAEAVGGLALVAGALTRLAALGLIVDMGVAIWKVHYRHGFFLNWTLQPGIGHGFEFNLTLVGALGCLLLAGAGALSVDGRRRRSVEAVRAGRAGRGSG